jgi:hypothetical protein
MPLVFKIPHNVDGAIFTPRPASSPCLARVENSSTSCDHAVLVDQTTNASLFLDAVLVEIDWLG